MFDNLLRLWMGPLPHQELFPSDRPVNLPVHWFIHPFKRRLAKIYLKILQKYFHLKVIAITGSGGKTATANLLYSILSATSPTVITADNVTSTYNIPTTILKCTPQTQYLILEMGVEYPGDMDYYTWLAKPDIAIITSVNRTHTQFLGSIERVALEKGKIAKTLDPQNGIVLVNGDDSHIQVDTKAKILKFGSSKDNFAHIESAAITPDLKTQVKVLISGSPIQAALPLLGRHYAYAAAAAASAANLLGYKPQYLLYGLQHVSSSSHRATPVILKNGNIVIDDSYNANPLAVFYALNTLSEIAKITKRIPVFIFGQMNELGQYEQSSHQEIGKIIKNLLSETKNLNLYCLGPATKFTLETAGIGQYFENLETLTQTIVPQIVNTANLVVLIKGSRKWELDKLVNKLNSQSK